MKIKVYQKLSLSSDIIYCHCKHGRCDLSCKLAILSSAIWRVSSATSPHIDGCFAATSKPVPSFQGGRYTACRFVAFFKQTVLMQFLRAFVNSWEATFYFKCTISFSCIMNPFIALLWSFVLMHACAIGSSQNRIVNFRSN